MANECQILIGAFIKTNAFAGNFMLLKSRYIYRRYFMYLIRDNPWQITHSLYGKVQVSIFPENNYISQ